MLIVVVYVVLFEVVLGPFATFVVPSLCVKVIAEVKLVNAVILSEP